VAGYVVSVAFPTKKAHAVAWASVMSDLFSARPGEIPDDQADERQHQNEHNPQGFLDRFCSALQHIDDRPDIQYKHHQPE